MSGCRRTLINFRYIFPILLIAAITSIAAGRYMIVRVREDSMAPTLTDGQFVVVERGVKGVRPGDIVVFENPMDSRLTVKRYVLKGNQTPMIDHGWLITPWGRWYLTGPQWESMDIAAKPPEPSFFLVGDNQFRSLDSRSYGFVKSDRLVGRVLLRRKNG
jgi:signal peptidase I